MKIFLFILIVVGSTLIGSSFSKKYKERLFFFKEFLHFSNVLQSEIKFSKNTLSMIVQKHISSYSGEFKQLINNHYILNKPINEVSFLKEKENVFLHNFFKSLGKFDVNGEIANISNVKQELNSYIAQCDEEFKKYGTLGTKLGLIFGILVCVILL